MLIEGFINLRSILGKNILDYGCSTGDFLAKINNTKINLVWKLTYLTLIILENTYQKLRKK